MKTNRREFIKGALSGAFGMLLTWAGAVRVEDATEKRMAKTERNQAQTADNFQHDPDRDLGRLFSQNGQIDWPRTTAMLEEIGILPREEAYADWAEASNRFHGDRIEYAKRLGGVKGGPDPIRFWDGVIESVNVYDPAFQDAFESDEGSGNVWYTHTSGFLNWSSDPSPACLDCACRAKCEADHIYWCSELGKETRADNPWSGGLIRHRGDGHLVAWSTAGSDEAGDGTIDNPVATEVCAQSIAEG